MILGAKFVKAADYSTGDTLKFLDEGAWIPSTKFTYEDGTPKQVLQFQVEDGKGEQKILSMNITNREALVSAWGRDTESWVGKTAQIVIREGEVAGQVKQLLRLAPVEVI